MQDTERWLPVPEWDGYEVSNRGRVRSLDRWVERGDRGGYFRRGKILSQRPAGKMGYLSVALCANGRQIHYTVHRLVLTAFAGPRPKDQQARHGPAGRLINTWPGNLCWGTPVEDHADRRRDGTMPRGASHSNAKLTEAIVLDCRARNANGESMGALAREFGVCVMTVSRVIHRETWAHV